MSDDDLIRRGDALAAVEAEPDWAAGIEDNLVTVHQAISALPAVTPAVRVKPLVWENVGRCIGWKLPDETTHLYVASGVGVNYEVAMGKSGWWAKWTGDYRAVAFQTADDAKAAAQADYEARILSALDVTSPKETVAESKPTPTLAEALELPEIKALVDFVRQEHDYWDRIVSVDLAMQDTMERAMDYPMVTEAMKKADAFSAALRRIKEEGE